MAHKLQNTCVLSIWTRNRSKMMILLYPTDRETENW